MTDMYHEWNGLIFGYKSGSEATNYPLVSADDSESLRHNGGLLDRPTDGSALGPLYAKSEPWITVVEVMTPPGSVAPDTDYWAQVDALKAATVKPTTVTELPYDVVMPDRDTVTRFARCQDRRLPTDEYSVVRHYGLAQLTFQASDPYTYSAEFDETIAIDGTYAWTSEGWAESYRWTAVISGPVTNPQIANPSLGTSAVIRYVGSIAANRNLVIHCTPTTRLIKDVHDDQLADFETYRVGELVYQDCDNGAARPNVPPRFFPVGTGSQSIAFDATAGSGSCVFTWREAKP